MALVIFVVWTVFVKYEARQSILILADGLETANRRPLQSPYALKSRGPADLEVITVIFFFLNVELSGAQEQSRAGGICGKFEGFDVRTVVPLEIAEGETRECVFMVEIVDKEG